MKISSENEDVKGGGAVVWLSQPYVGCGWYKATKKKKEKRIRCAVGSDLFPFVHNQKDQPISEKKKKY